MNKERFENLIGIRAYACIGIVLMHVLLNGYSGLGGILFSTIIPSFTDFTYLFMLISSFSLCCGYYEKVKQNTINLEEFYTRRYSRVWPFFAFLCSIEMVISHDWNSVYEWFADLSLMFGFLPDNRIEVLGVGWFLGTVFVFYMIFPFFCFTIAEKRRAWLTLAISLILHFLCIIRFSAAANRANIVYSSIFFIAGGIIYLYRHKLTQLRAKKWIAMIVLMGTTVLYYFFPDLPVVLLFVFSALTILGISDGKIGKVLFQNKIALFIGGLSMEIYLCHMFVYRCFEKIKVTHFLANDIVNYSLICVGSILGAIAVALVFRYCSSLLKKLVAVRKK